MNNTHFNNKPRNLKLGNLIKRFMGKKGLKQRHKEKIDFLRKNGLKIGKNVIIHPKANIDFSYCYLISIGDNSIICRGTKILAHDATIFPYTDGHGRLGKVDIKENCIISTDVTILPGVTIGPNALVASGSVVNKDIPPNSCVAGVPARYYSSFEDYINKHLEDIRNSYVVDARQLLLNKNGIDDELKKKIIEECEKGSVYLSHCKEMVHIRENFI